MEREHVDVELVHSRRRAAAAKEMTGRIVGVREQAGVDEGAVLNSRPRLSACGRDEHDRAKNCRTASPPR